MSRPTSPAPAGQSGTPSSPTPAPNPARVRSPHSELDVAFGAFWPEPRRVRERRDTPLLVAAALVAVVAGALLPGRPTGVALWVVVLAGSGVVGRTFWARARPESRALTGVFGLLVTMIIFRDAQWAVEIALAAAAGLGLTVLTRATSVRGMIIALWTLPLAWIRGLPWLKRTLPLPRRLRLSLPVVRTLLISGTLLLIFVGLFASADLVFAGWLSSLTRLIPTTVPEDAVVVFLGTLALVLGGAYVGLNPPRVERGARSAVTAVRRFEWVTPIVAVIGVFTAFLGAQLTALFGGHGYLRGQGLSYADYVHEGFGQLTVATAIVLLVVGLTLRYAPRRAGDQRLVRLLLGLLGGLALVVVASALYRMALYAEAYGYTGLRLLVAVFEAWLGLVLLLATTAGVWLRARWVPKVAVIVGVLMVLGLTVASPDAIVADHNSERYASTGRIDPDYLADLSADAVPALDRLPEPLRSCVLGRMTIGDSTGLSWNFGRARAHALLAARPIDTAAVCPTPDRF